MYIVKSRFDLLICLKWWYIKQNTNLLAGYKSLLQKQFCGIGPVSCVTLQCIYAVEHVTR